MRSSIIRPILDPGEHRLERALFEVVQENKELKKRNEELVKLVEACRDKDGKVQRMLKHSSCSCPCA